MNLAWIAMSICIATVSCSKTETEVNSSKTLPTQVVIDIPSAISSAGTLKASLTQNDTINGGDIYTQLRLFIGIGEASANVVQGIFDALKQYKINKPMEFDFTSNDDQRAKHAVVVENSSYEGNTYDLKLTITDGTNKALQVYWSANPVKGVAILSPYWINNKELVKDAMYKIEFGRADGTAYDSHMIVSITGIPAIGVYGMDKMKMYVGKKGKTVEAFGNSNHPNAKLFDLANTHGFSYAFALRADSTANIAVAKLALLSTSIATTTNLFTTYSDEMHKIWDPMADTPEKKAYVDAVIARYAAIAQIPAFFTSKGYVGCGTTLPAGFTADFVNISNLMPYAPKDIKNMTISFGE